MGRPRANQTFEAGIDIFRCVVIRNVCLGTHDWR